MPHVSISMYQGKSVQEKETLAQRIHEAVVKEMGCSPEALSVSFAEYSPEEFVPSVKSSIEKEELVVTSRVIT